MEAWREELYHHGILGQKWGKRNGPPYPLDGKNHSVSEKKAGWKKSLKKITESDRKKKIKRAIKNKDVRESKIQKQYLDNIKEIRSEYRFINRLSRDYKNQMRSAKKYRNYRLEKSDSIYKKDINKTRIATVKKGLVAAAIVLSTYSIYMAGKYANNNVFYKAGTKMLKQDFLITKKAVKAGSKSVHKILKKNPAIAINAVVPILINKL